ncbi:beta-glucosidase 2 [Fusarium circinatum]|uniref:Beta-glucosidase 2 n=1 Tax=Fusarium circinatum TaxID=48490 RepID=A0A8H5TU91_FUSCI|nr:beta-glucosidase 2 [Fusarium circinatum]
MENNNDTPQRFSTVRRELPGCRPCGLNWNKCKVHLIEHDDTLAISFKMENVSWKKRLEIQNGVLQCNLQDLTVLRWIDHSGNDSASGIQPLDYTVHYPPRERYECLFPHSATEAHEVFEVTHGMLAEELRELGKESMARSIIMLCPTASSLCKSRHGVESEVQTLAKYWPMRQVLKASAVEGFVDITPVSVCQNDPAGNCCISFNWTEPEISPTRIRMSMSSQQMVRYVDDSGPKSPKGYIYPNRDLNPYIAIHSSSYHDILSAIQPAVLHCRQRKAKVRPTRIYDAQDRVTKSDVEPAYYLALSYSWNDWPLESTLESKVGELSQRLGIRYFWVDRWCIDQDDDADKRREVPLMRGYYEGSSGCVVLTGKGMQSFQFLPMYDGTVLAAYQQLMENRDAIISLLCCRWTTRIWTMQEALMSRQVIYAIDNQLIDGDYISELMAYIQTFSEIYEHHNDINQWVGGYGCYGWNARMPSLFKPRQFSDRINPEIFTVIRTIFGGEQQYMELKAYGGLQMPLEQALVVVEGREASRKGDYIYGVLGITENGHKIEVEDGIPWMKMLRKLQAAGMVTERQLASPTVNSLPGMSWLPESGRYYGPFTQMERLASFIDSPPVKFSNEGAKVLGTACCEFTTVEGEEWAVLYDKVNPSGKLPYTVAKNESDYGHLIDLNVPRGLYLNFLQNLNYTTYKFNNLEIEKLSGAKIKAYPTGPIKEGGQTDLWDMLFKFTATVTNAGQMDGAEAA